jgi:hypothetical protein
MGEMGKGEMGTAHAGKPPSLPRELRTPLVLCLVFHHFERPIGIVALSVNHIIRNFDGALLFLFSSVSVEIAL